MTEQEILEKVVKSYAEKAVERTIAKFNPYHEEHGRFTVRGAASSFTYSPGKSKAHDMAIEREKERMAAARGYSLGSGGTSTSGGGNATAGETEGKTEAEGSGAANGSNKTKENASQTAGEKITATTEKEAFNQVDEARVKHEKITLQNTFDGDTVTESFAFKVGFPNGFKANSVAAWYSTKNKKNYMTQREMARYISNVNSGYGASGVKYTVTRQK